MLRVSQTSSHRGQCHYVLDTTSTRNKPRLGFLLDSKRETFPCEALLINRERERKRTVLMLHMQGWKWHAASGVEADRVPESFDCQQAWRHRGNEAYHTGSHTPTRWHGSCWVSEFSACIHNFQVLMSCAQVQWNAFLASFKPYNTVISNKALESRSKISLWSRIIINKIIWTQGTWS